MRGAKAGPASREAGVSAEVNRRSDGLTEGAGTDKRTRACEESRAYELREPGARCGRPAGREAWDLRLVIEASGTERRTPYYP